MQLFDKKPIVTAGAVQNDPEPEAEKEIKDLKLKISQLEGIQSAMPDPYYVRDMNYNIVIWPEKIAKVTGYSEAEAKKLKCYEVFKAGVCPPASSCPTQNCINTRQFLRDVAVDVYDKRGGVVHALVSNAGVYGEDGNPIGAVEIVKDNTAIQNSMDSIGLIIKDIEQESSGLGGVMEKVSVTTGKVNEMSSETLGGIKAGVQAGSTVSEKAGQSEAYASNIQGNMQTINESMKFSVEKISRLKLKSDSIIEFVKVIQDIAAKTNLLAINASIEAAHAGESGRGFKVVADGIRELSRNSSESAASIRATIHEITGLIQETTNSLSVTDKDISAGIETVAGLSAFVGEIDESAKTMLDVLTRIENAASVSFELGEEQKTAVAQAGKVGSHMSEIARQLTLEFDKVFMAIQHKDMK